MIRILKNNKNVTLMKFKTSELAKSHKKRVFHDDEFIKMIASHINEANAKSKSLF